jgi:hypothetical protein
MIALLTKPLALILIACVVFGGFGGLVAHYINNEKRGASAKLAALTGAGWFPYPSAFQSACIGIAGSLGFTFFIVAVGGLTDFEKPPEQLRCIAISVIAGFGARSLLPLMVGHLEQQVAEAKTEAEKASQDANKAQESAEASARRLKTAEARIQTLDLNMKLLEAAHPNAARELRREVLAIARAAMRDGTAKPVIWINAARVERWDGALDAAIQMLDEAVEAFESGKLEKDRNYLKAYYNRGCYYEQKFLNSQDPRHRNCALRDIEQWLRLADDKAAHIRIMEADPDLAKLRELDGYRGLVAQYAPLRDRSVRFS